DRNGVESFEGIVPPILQRLPVLHGSFYNQAFAVDDSVAYSVFELDPAIFRWRHGTSKADRIEFPKRLRRGVATSDFDEMVRNPAKAAELAYNHSLPMQMTFASPWLLAIAMYDVDVVGQSFVGRYFVSYVDLREGRICPDLPVPVPTDPPARITFSADTIIAIQQMLNAAGKPTTAIRRFWFNGAGCAWQPLALP
ncbi:MAG: hypothetical protein Q8K82_08670, partial [Gemmatimonadaceae bacterium]|nr:hypothetical protein [Gemmatimonadaceae bacterium]